MIKKQELARALGQKLKAKPRSTKENHVWYIHNGKRILRVTYMKGRGDIKKGTLTSIRNQLRLTSEQLDDFVKCPMTGKEYEKHLRSLGLI
jgi:predicted RNA binding protein YcfA (HicA-like mRNA interferase family)